MHNTFCWVDIPVIHLDRAIGFYSALLGKKVEKIQDHGFIFGLLPHEENNVSGCLTEMADREPSIHGPMVYLNVDGRMDQAVEAARLHGVQILSEKTQIGSYGYRAVVMDTEGNAIALHSGS